MDEDKYREGLLRRLDAIIRLLLEASPPIQSSNMPRLAGRLSEMGFSSAEIAGILGMKSRHVSTALERLKTSRSKGNK